MEKTMNAMELTGRMLYYFLFCL